MATLGLVQRHCTLFNNVFGNEPNCSCLFAFDSTWKVHLLLWKCQTKPDQNRKNFQSSKNIFFNKPFGKSKNRGVKYGRNSFKHPKMDFWIQMNFFYIISTNNEFPYSTHFPWKWKCIFLNDHSMQLRSFLFAMVWKMLYSSLLSNGTELRRLYNKTAKISNKRRRNISFKISCPINILIKKNSHWIWNHPGVY